MITRIIIYIYYHENNYINNYINKSMGFSMGLYALLNNAIYHRCSPGTMKALGVVVTKVYCVVKKV